jgi:serine/threonine protein kinase
MASAHACAAIQQVLLQETTSYPPYSIRLTTLSQRIDWAKDYAPSLGKIKQFLENNSHLFRVISQNGPGNDVIQYITNYQPIDLCRPFDELDQFAQPGQEQAYEKIGAAAEKMWNKNKKEWFRSYFPHHEEEARRLFDRSFQKCTRLTIRIAFVPAGASYPDLKSKIMKQMKQCGDPSARLFLYMDYGSVGAVFTTATLWCPGQDQSAQSALFRVVNALEEGTIPINGNICSLFRGVIGFAPGETAVKTTIDELMQVFPPPPIDYPPSPDRRPVASPPLPVAALEVVIAEPVEILPPAPDLWPTEFTYASALDPVVFPSNAVVREAIRVLEEKEFALRNRDESSEIPYFEIAKEGVEWMCDDGLGSGAEASVYLGLYANPARDREKQLVAVKVNLPGRSVFNSQEKDHMIQAGGLPGIVKYYCGFTVQGFGGKQAVLVQDVGCMTLRKLILQASAPDPTSKLTDADKFRLTKAACLAVEKLHSLDPTVVHRDLRPENVLIMPNGTLCLTDFGLARKKPKALKGSSLYTRTSILTAMQPYEVQRLFAEERDRDRDRERETAAVEELLPILHPGDVFMLGCVLAFIHVGRDPFTDLTILNREEPDLGGELAVQNPWLDHLIRCMLRHDFTTRPTMEMVLRHPYFATRAQNFDNRIERVIVSDFNGIDRGPTDDQTFRTLENILRPIEQKLVDDRERGEAWYELLPPELFEGQARLPFSVNRIRFLEGGGEGEEEKQQQQPRDYPLPETARLVKWMRNACTHLHADRNLQTKLRKARGGRVFQAGVFFATPGEFFSRHPAVCWFLPLVWEQSIRVFGDVARRRKEFTAKYFEACKALDDEETSFLTVFG